MGSRCFLGVVIHDSLIIISHHAVNFVAFPVIWEQALKDDCLQSQYILYVYAENEAKKVTYQAKAVLSIMRGL